MKSTYCEYILEKILTTSEVGPILALIARSPLHSILIITFLYYQIQLKLLLYYFDIPHIQLLCVVLIFYDVQERSR